MGYGPASYHALGRVHPRTGLRVPYSRADRSRDLIPALFPTEPPGPVDPEPAECGTDFLESGMDWLAGQLQLHMSKPVTYVRGDGRIAVCATFGRKAYRLDDGEGGTRVEWTDRDFLIPATSLVIDGNQTLPRRGDKIRERVGSQVHVFEVSAPGGEAIYEWADSYHKMIRVHTKRGDTE